MSSIQLQGNSSGTGVMTVSSPNTNTNYTITLPQADTTLVGTDATQTLTNKTITGGTISSAASLDVTGNTTLTGYVGIGGGTPASNPKLSMYGGIRFLATEAAANTYTGVGSIQSDAVSISCSGIERFRIGPGGGFGISGGTYGTSGQVLTSAGGDTSPTWASASGGIGYSQTWQNVTASRSWNTTYTNTTGKPIQILILGHCQPNQEFRLTINGTATTIGNSMGGGMSGDGYLTAIIPNGVTYLADNFGSGYGTPGYAWWELR
jgi:hypothetical protein